MRNETNQTEYNNQRKLYMDGKLSHQDFYTWLANFIGANERLLPISKERIEKSNDANLNDIPLILWDSQDYVIRRLAYNKGLAWSLSDTVCVLKTIARNAIKVA